jgi:fructose-1,6-bisphosphatase/inositol monophosphatase family enzyme
VTAAGLGGDVPTGDVERYHAAVIELADAARQIAAPMLEGDFRIETKADASPVTEVDRAIERRLREMIGRWFPDHGVVGEEYPAERPDRAYQWILDPIDGTAELIHGIPTWGAILALHHHGVPVVGLIDHPPLDLRVSAGTGLGAYRNGQRIRLPEMAASVPPEAVRLVLTARINFTRGIDEGHVFEALTRRFPNHRIYRAAYAHTAVVTGAADVMVVAHDHIWDVAAAQVLIEEAGGAYTVVRDFETSAGRLLSVVFGKRGVVDRLTGVFVDSAAG